MAIKNRDGTTFRLSGPNPIMKSQMLWDDFQLHNFNLSELTLTDEPKEPQQQLAIVISEDDHPIPEKIVKEEETPKKTFKDLDEIEPEDFEVPVRETPKPPPPPKKKVPDNVPKMTIHCLPAQARQYQDPLYGDTKTMVSYGNKFSLEAVVVSETDLTIDLWTNVSLGYGSIIFVPKDRRWWKSVKVVEKFGGWLINCVPSELTPSFQN